MGNGTFDFKSITEKFHGKKATVILLIIGFIGIALIFLSEFIHPGAAKAQQTAQDTDVTAFESETESRLDDIIGRISGVGRVQVMVTVESGVENVYEQDNKTQTDQSQQNGGDGSVQSQENNSSEQTPIVVDGSNGGQSALVEVQKQPQILGVVVVCDGGGNADVQESVVDSVSVALGLPSNKISVCRMKPQ